MKTDYELIKDFPKELYYINYEGNIEVKHVKEAHFCGKYGIEIDLGNGEYVYDSTYKSHKIEFGVYTKFGKFQESILRGYCVDRVQAECWAKMMRDEDMRSKKRYEIYSAYVEAKRAGGILTFDFSRR